MRMIIKLLWLVRKFSLWQKAFPNFWLFAMVAWVKPELFESYIHRYITRNLLLYFVPRCFNFFWRVGKDTTFGTLTTWPTSAQWAISLYPYGYNSPRGPGPG